MASTIRYEPDQTDPDRMLMTETWRLDDPDCPFRILKCAEDQDHPGRYHVDWEILPRSQIAHRAGGASK